MLIYLLFLMPIFTSLIGFFYFKHKIVWWEYLINYGITFLCVFVSKKLITYPKTDKLKVFDYLTAEPDFNHILIAFLLVFAVNTIVLYVTVTNDINQNKNEGNRF